MKLKESTSNYIFLTKIILNAKVFDDFTLVYS